MCRYLSILFFTGIHLFTYGQLTLSVDPQLNNKYNEIICSLESNRNIRVTKYSDQSPHAPTGFKIPGIEQGKEIWFPVIDNQLVPDMKMLVEFEGFSEGDQVCWNGHITRDCRPVKQLMTFEDHLEHWENQLYVISEKARISNVKIQFPVHITSEGNINISTLAHPWEGKVEIKAYNGQNWDIIKDTTITAPKVKRETPDIAAMNSRNLNHALNATLSFLTHSQNLNPISPYYGGLYLFYDLNDLVYCRPDWVWSYGPSIKLFIESAGIQPISTAQGYENLMTSARLMAEASLRYQVLEKDHPAYGLVECRNDPRMDSPQGSERFCSPADSYFLAGWGWIPYYEATGDQRFLDAAKLMTHQIERILTYDELIEQDYLMKAGQWKNWTMDESGFGMKGAEAVVKATGDEHFREIGQDYIEGLLKYLEREDGLWDRTWHRNRADYSDNGWVVGEPRGNPVLIETKYSTRGLGWAMIGLLAAHGMMPDGGYLEKAIKMADYLMKYQQPEGYWSFIFKGGNDDEISVKGTTLWSLLFYELYHYTNDPEHLLVARKALLWCMSHQDVNKASPTYGGISEITMESGVVYRRWNEVACTYAMAWYGLAIIEELKISASK